MDASRVNLRRYSIVICMTPTCRARNVLEQCFIKGLIRNWWFWSAVSFALLLAACLEKEGGVQVDRVQKELKPLLSRFPI